jgi:hypothetical protein
MSTVTGSQIVARARIVLQDDRAARYRYLDAHTLTWINEGQVDAAVLNPRIAPLRYVHTLTAGTRQTVTQGHAVLDIPRNMAADEVTPGRAIRATTRPDMDAVDPNWHSDVGTSVKHVIQSPAEPKVFYVWPAVSGGKVEVIVGAPPAKLAALTDTISLDDIYEVALTNYVLYRCLSIEDEEQSAQRAAAYYTLFVNSVKGAA